MKGSPKKIFILRLIRILGFLPGKIGLYELAFTHKSASLSDSKGNPLNYERLEYLGDAVLGLIIAELVKTHDLAAKPEQVRAMVQEQAETYEQPDEVVKWVYSQPQRLAEVESLVLEDNVVSWVLEHAKVEEKTVQFDEFMGKAA